MVFVMLPRIYRTEADVRKQQINTLKVFNANVSELTEGIEYQVDFHAGEHNFKLIISLGNDFPNEKPLLKIIPNVVHAWVNKEGDIISAPGLLNFTIHSDLGRVVHAIIREFERNPPKLVSEHEGGATVSSSLSIRDSEKSSPSYMMNFPTTSNFSPPSHLNNINNISFAHGNIFPELNKLSLKELKSLNENLDKREDFLLELPQIKDQNRMIDELLTQVEDLSGLNLSKQELLEKLRKGIEFRIEQVTNQTFRTEQLHHQYERLSEKFSPKNIQEELRLASRKADEDSEKLAETFMNGEIEVDKFLSSYIKSRTLYQTRKTKEEKLSQQLDNLKKAGY